MKEKWIARLLTAALVLLCLVCPAAAEDAPALTLRLAEPLTDGAESVLLDLGPVLPDGLRVNAFLDGEEIGLSAEAAEDGLVLLRLSRPLREGDTVRLAADVPAEDGHTLAAEAAVPVLNRFHAKLASLRCRVDRMWPVWENIWLPAFRAGEVFLRIRLENMPFITFPDEAPEIIVEERDGRTLVRLSEELPEDWTVFFSGGIPVTLTPAVYDEAAGAWTGDAGILGVFLVSPQAERRMKVTVMYWRMNQFLPAWPVVEYAEEGETGFGFNCYGSGTARSFQGGMYGLFGDHARWFASYDVTGALTGYTDETSGCAYSLEGTLLSGTEPEGGHDRITIW